MNAAIRSVVRTGLYHDLEVVGVMRGYAGLIEADFRTMDRNSVSDIIQRGGTVLLSARCDEFMTVEGRQKALRNMQENGIEGLVVIGGDGSFRGAEKINLELGIPAIGIPGTIDNDLAGTDYTIGYDTAMNTILDAINKIRDTATSHERTFVIETMGRDNGFLTVMTGLASGAEAILIPEMEFDLQEICDKLIARQQRGKQHNLILVAEGIAADFQTNPDAKESVAYSIGRIIAERTGQETRVIILGHLQRGGSPTALDRIIASRMGARAVELLLAGQKNKMVGFCDNEIVTHDLSEILNTRKDINMELYSLGHILS
ncbi:MAG: 6-phosphofructokinase [Halanaerobiales bacterium]|nr:6-phosphofructokinase [Halanaerobiales bacterium]